MASKQVDKPVAAPETIGAQVRESWANSSIFEQKITKFVNDVRDYKLTKDQRISAVWLSVTSDEVLLVPITPIKSSSSGDGKIETRYE